MAIQRFEWLNERSGVCQKIRDAKKRRSQNRRRVINMPVQKKRRDFNASEDGLWAVQALDAMVLDESYVTVSSFCADTANYPDNLISFTDKHMRYLQNHSKTDVRHYLSNLKMMTKIR
jgi:hypothetical protein